MSDQVKTVKDWKTTIPGIAGLITGAFQIPGIPEMFSVNPGTARGAGIAMAVAMSIQLIFGAIWPKKK